MLRIFPIGGIADVTKNMFVYEVGDDMLIVDCGIGFPDETMPGVEFLIPDTQYLQDRLKQGAKLHGIVLTHGHDDHIAALPYVLRELNVNVPMYGSPLTAEFAMSRLADNGVEREVTHFDDGVLEIGPFSIETIRVTHSIPDTRHLVIRTPEGIIYHGSDFKFDLTPVDGEASDLQAIARVGEEGVLCALIDCLRIERPWPTPSESTVITALREEMRDVKGKVIVTLMSSSIHRIQQAIDVAIEQGRRVAFIGRSVEQNVNTAMNMNMLHLPSEVKLNKRKLADVDDSQLCIIIAGSQGQPGSSLVRAVFGTHNFITLSADDKIIFSSDPIPGSEKNVYRTINEITNRGIAVSYSDLNSKLHVSGHASEYEQMLLVHLLRPQYLFPVGGENRHRVQFSQTVQKHGYEAKEVVLPLEGKWVEFANGKMRYGDKQVKLRQRTVDGTGVANVIGQHLNEREALGKSGALIVFLHEDGGSVALEAITIDRRGITLGDEVKWSDFDHAIKEVVQDVVMNNDATKQDSLRRDVEKAVGNLLQKEYGMSPLVIVAVSSL